MSAIAIVLHAHLPWVRHSEHAAPLEERWLHEALWECYLPLADLLDRLAREGVRARLSISISPTLAAMLGDPLLRDRFEAHLGRLTRLAESLVTSTALAGEARALVPFYVDRLEAARATWDRLGRDVLGAFVEHHRQGRIELVTTTVTHAYLPGLLADPASVRAQLRLGRRAFEALSGVRPRGMWLPECAYDPRLGEDLARAGVAYTVLDAHGLLLANPKPQGEVVAPILAHSGVAFFGRDPQATHDVWSRRGGYPGDPVYRDFYRDVGFDLPERELMGELGPNGNRIMTGIKLHRITGEGSHKEIYDPELAAARAREHARHFVGRRQGRGADGVLVAPFDAELFGHWWFEGPTFLEQVLRELDASARTGGVGSVSLGEHLERHPDLVVADPAASTWGEGGFGAVWAGPEAARLWRHVHHAERAVREATRRARGATDVRGEALDQAIRELCLLQSSDWAFMIRRGDMTPYAEARVRSHAHRATRLAAIALAASASGEDARWVEKVRESTPFLHELEGERIRDAFDAWG